MLMSLIKTGHPSLGMAWKNSLFTIPSITSYRFLGNLWTQCTVDTGRYNGGRLELCF